MSEVPILPPLGAKAKKSPHSRRTTVVFQALDEASLQGITTYDALIDFVREATGTGCSRKLICKWKKERSTGLEAIAKSSAVLPEPEPAINHLQPVEVTATTPEPQPKKHSLSRLVLCFKTPLKRLLLPVAAIGVGLAVVGQALPSLGDRPLTAATSQTQTPSSAAPEENKVNPPRQLKFSLSVLSPTDLKVKQGDVVEAGQVIAERVAERDRLLADRNLLDLQYQQIQSRTVPKPAAPVPIPSVHKLPPISYVEEEAVIRAAETNVRQAERAFQLQQQNLRQAPLEESNAVERAAVEVENQQRLVDNQKQKLDAVKLLKDLPSSVQAHEQEVLKAKQAELKQAQADYNQVQARLEAASRAQVEKLQQLGAALEKARADLQLAISKLQTKKDQRAYTEYEASITAARRAEEQNSAQERYSRNLLEVEQQERDRNFQLTQIKAKINDVNNQLAALSVVTSPYSGTVKAIKFQKQANSELLVELTLAVSRSTPATSDRPDNLPTVNNPS